MDENMPQMTQVEYIAILFIDCGYHSAAHRRAWLKDRFGKQYADELTTEQKSKAIEALKIEKGLGL